MFKQRCFWGVLTLTTLLAGCRDPDDEDLAPFDESTCPFALHPTQVTEPGPTQTVRCGMLSVLESRDGSSERRIQIPALIFKSQHPRSAPVFELAGGPGQSWADLGLETISLDDTKSLGRDLVFVEQRGTGRSMPRLDCPELEASSMDEMGTSMNPITACRDRLRTSGIALAAYNTAAMATDVEELRATLGYPRILLSGTSYGTTWGLEILRRYASVIDRAILDSVVPPQIVQLRRRASARDGALTALILACEADVDCRTKFPFLDAQLGATIAALEKQPIAWSAVPGGKFTASHYVSSLDTGQFEKPELVPYFMTEVQKAALAGTSLDSVDERVRALVKSSSTATASLSVGMYFSVFCQKNHTVTQAEIEADAERGRPALRPYFKNSALAQLAVCNEWPHASSDTDAPTPVVSSVPTLLLSGALDPRTPPAWARSALSTLSRASLLLFPGLSHSVRSTRSSTARACISNSIGQFIAQGSAPDSQCAQGVKPVWFFR